MSAAAGGLTFVLHTHLPWVIHHGRWPHGSDWLCEAVADCYLPLLDVLEPRARAGHSLGITLSLSPVLLEQLETTAFDREFRSWLGQKRSAARDDARRFAAAGGAAEAALARRWGTDLERASEGWRGGADLIERFRSLAGSGRVELIACAATHGYLPLLGTPAAVCRQIALAVESHRARFGSAPRGLWLPECAYRPGGPWTSAVDANVHESWRPGLESWLGEFGIEYFLVETHLVTGGRPLESGSERVAHPHPRARGARRGATRTAGSDTARVHRAGDSRVLCIGRDAGTSRQVWSREGGYPGDPAYREFHRRHDPGGHRYWAVSAAGTALDEKQVYDPDAAVRRVAAHARDFLERVAARPRFAGEAPVVCAMYDTELFGHWWHEGPAFLARVIDRAASFGIRLSTAAEQVEGSVSPPPMVLGEGSWGSGGGHDTWLAPETRAMWSDLHGIERRFEAIARRALGRRDPWLDRVLEQALREILLLEASDWPFLVTQRSARDYAEARAAAHARDAARLLDLATRRLEVAAHRVAEAPPAADEARLAECEARDGPFPRLDWRAGLVTGAALVAAPFTPAARAAPARAARAARRAPVRAFHRGRGSNAASSRSRAGRRPPRAGSGS